jgi:2-hydroxycyclohexanecarboxyl-CoA dehydrogenase
VPRLSIRGASKRQALVTGAASGIGAAIASVLRARGVRVIGFDLTAADDCDAHIVGDVADRAAVAEVIDSHGGFDFAVTAAGYYEPLELEQPDPARWRKMLRVHVHGTFNVIDSVLPEMYARRAGSICTVSSELALIGDPQAPHYAAAKGAVAALTKSVAVEAAGYGVRVNCLAPGPCDTPLLPAEHRTAEAVNALPLRRLLHPEEVAACAAWLLLAETNMVGQLVSPNAGAVL